MNNAVIEHKEPPEGVTQTTFSMTVIKTLPPNLSLEVYLAQLGYTHGYIWTDEKGNEFLTATREQK